MEGTVRTRFAPSPTGHLHLGHIYAATFARNLALENGGEFLLRFEDIDTTRVRQEYYTQIETDLQWLGLTWHGTPIRQTNRIVEYDQAMQKLEALGVIYPCFCTRKEIQRELKHITNAPHGAPEIFYPETCRHLPPETIVSKLAEGKTPSHRINIQAAAKLAGPLTFHDQTYGKISVDPTILEDTILARKDIGTSYHIAVTIDDAFQNITHVTRGEDLLNATHLHRILQTLLNLPEPNYAHHILINDQTGTRLAKRNQPLSIKSLKESGLTPQQVLQKLPL